MGLIFLVIVGVVACVIYSAQSVATQAATWSDGSNLLLFVAVQPAMLGLFWLLSGGRSELSFKRRLTVYAFVVLFSAGLLAGVLYISRNPIICSPTTQQAHCTVDDSGSGERPDQI